MNVERLNKLIELLETIPDADFDLRNWVGKYEGAQLVDNPKPDLILDGNCGTVACAVGWACLDPWFNSQGLKLDLPPNCVGSEPTYYCPNEDWEYFGFSAVAAFFDIHAFIAEELFLPIHYPETDRVKPSQVIEKIKEFMIQENQHS